MQDQSTGRTIKPVTIMLLARKETQRDTANITVRIDPAVADAFKACCADMKMSYTDVFEGLVKWYSQLPRSSRQLIVGVLDDDQIASIAHEAMIESLSTTKQPGRRLKGG